GRKETHKTLGNLDYNKFDRQKFVEKLQKRKKEGKPVFTGAYMVSGYQKYKGDNKIENISHLLQKISSQKDNVIKQLEEAEKFKSAYKKVKELPGIGRFLAYQILVDLTYGLGKREKIIDLNQNEWAKAGPGAEKGLKKLIKDDKKFNENDIMKYLYENQESYFSDLKEDFIFIKNYKGERKRLSLPDIQNCLCEFYKYDKIKNNNGRTRRKFDSQNSNNADLRELYENAPEVSIQNIK
ncbi:MAG: nucleotide kinase domain-containing protein, partial [Candidatus Nanohaloarchaea archaeon]